MRLGSACFYSECCRVFRSVGRGTGGKSGNGRPFAGMPAGEEIESGSIPGELEGMEL